MNQICFEHVTKFFPGATRPAIDDITLDVESGRFTVFLGPSGCGKTTLLKMVNRLIEPSSGRVLLNGTDIQQLEPTRLRRKIGYVIQQIGLFPHMTVRENISLVPQMLNWPKDSVLPRVNELLNLVHLPAEEYCNRYPSQLSGGQAQRVGLARALAADPELMLMDEPFGAIDAINRAGLQDEMLHLRSRIRKTILFVTHDVDEALRLADKIAIMREGKIVQYDTPYRILSHPADDFVRQLVGADDIMRRLGLIRVEAVMQLIAGSGINHHAHIPRTGTLRDALSILLRDDVSTLAVTDQDRVIGYVGLDDIKRTLRPNPDETGSV